MREDTTLRVAFEGPSHAENAPVDVIGATSEFWSHHWAVRRERLNDQRRIALLSSKVGKTVMILGVHHVAIATHDLDRLSRFYRDQLGFELLYEKSWADSPQTDAIVGIESSAARLVMLRLGSQHLELFEYSNPRSEPRMEERSVSKSGITHFAFSVLDIELEYMRLLSAGVRFHAPPSDGDLRATYGRDPDGNVFELLEVTGDHPLRVLSG